MNSKSGLARAGNMWVPHIFDATTARDFVPLFPASPFFPCGDSAALRSPAVDAFDLPLGRLCALFRDSPGLSMCDSHVSSGLPRMAPFVSYLCLWTFSILKTAFTGLWNASTCSAVDSTCVDFWLILGSEKSERRSKDTSSQSRMGPKPSSWHPSRNFGFYVS